MFRNIQYIGHIILSTALLGVVSAQASVWTGGGADNEFSTTNNWNDGGINGTQDINGPYTVERVVDSTCSRTFVSGGATLNVTGGTHNDNLSGANRWNFIGSSSVGTVNQSGGSYSIGHGLRIGGDNASAHGTYNLTGGTLAVYRGSNSAIEPSNPGGRPSLEVGGTTLGSGLFEISSGSFETRAGVHIGGTGTFSVQGSAATSIGIGSNQSADGLWLQKAGGTLKVGVDTVGVTKIFIDDVDAATNQFVIFESGALLDVDFTGAFTNGGTFTVMELENGAISNAGLAFAAGVDTGIWSFNIDNSGTNGLLTVTAVGAPYARVPGDVTWTGAVSADWWNALNWDSGDGLIAGDTAFINSGTVDFSSGTSSNLNAFKLKAGTLNISGGALKANNSPNRESWVGDTGGATATVNQTGGSTDINALEVGRGSGSAGVYNLSGGDFKIGRGVNGNSLYLGGNRGGNNAGAGTFTISGGSFITRTGVKLGDDTSAGTGTFAVLGSAATQIGVGSSGSLDGVWYQGSGSTLKLGVDLGGVTKIFVADNAEGKVAATFEAGALLDVDYYNGGYGGGTWTVMEVENGTITNHGLAFAPGVDTGIWSFSIDNSGANGKLILTAAGDPPPPQIDVTLSVGDTRRQMMRYGLDYERLWYWYGSGLDPVPQWSVNDCNIDYIRCAMNSDYELTETNFNLSAYTSKIIPMMAAMQNANPNIKWFASPRPLNEAVSGASWQPYPLWVTGASSYTAGDYNFQAIKCAEYIIHYLLLMKSYGFKITYLDLTNEWQSNVTGGRLTQSDARDISEYLHVTYLANPWEHPDIPGLVLTADDMPLLVGPSSWNYSQGASWINNLNTQAKKDAIDIASSHNTDKTGTAQGFADAVAAACNPGTEIWETEQHGWKGNSSTSEAMSFSYMIETVRAGFSGINGWLAIGTTSQGHCYLLNNGSTVKRNVKYYMFKKLSNTSNYGYALDIDQMGDLSSTMALVRNNLLTIWVINTGTNNVVTEFDLGSHVWDGSDITLTRWDESLSINADETPEGITEAPVLATASNVVADLAGRAAYCIEIPLVNNEDNFPFVQAENYTTGSGVSILPCSDAGGGDMVAFASAGSETTFDLDIVKTYPHDVAFRVSSASADIAFDIYDGTNLLASVDRIATGGDQNWTTLYKTLHLDGGPMSLRIVSRSNGWNLNWISFEQQFYNPGSTLQNLALNQPATASNVHSTGYEADKAVDGDTGTRWATSTSNPWLQLNFGALTTVNSVSINDYGDRIKGFEIQYFQGVWKTAYVGGNPDAGTTYSFPAVSSAYFRLQTLNSINPSVYEFGLYYDPYYTESDPAIAAMTLDGSSASLEWSGVEGSTYALQRSTNLVDGFTTIESGIPVHGGTNVNTIATPDDAAFYRIILE